MPRKILLSFFAFLMYIAPCLSQSRTIVVDKPNLRLYVLEQADTLFSAAVCVGANYGDKVRKGDKRTPEGSFSISQIQNSSKWTHDFGDGKGEISGAYGPWFLRIKMPKWTSIGFHGTCFPESVGTRASEGCIRLHNQDIVKLKSLVSVGTKVVILPDK